MPNSSENRRRHSSAGRRSRACPGTPARAPRAGSGRVRSRPGDEPARDVGVLVEVVARADPVVAVRDRERARPCRRDRARAAPARGAFRARPSRGPSSTCDVVGGKQREPTRAEQILGLLVDRSAPRLERVDDLGHRSVGCEEAQVVGGGREVVLLGLVLPVLPRQACGRVRGGYSGSCGVELGSGGFVHASARRARSEANRTEPRSRARRRRG